jgi:hypothetical protein
MNKNGLNKPKTVLYFEQFLINDYTLRAIGILCVIAFVVTGKLNKRVKIVLGDIGN